MPGLSVHPENDGRLKSKLGPTGNYEALFKRKRGRREVTLSHGLDWNPQCHLPECPEEAKLMTASFPGFLS